MSVGWLGKTQNIRTRNDLRFAFIAPETLYLLVEARNHVLHKRRKR
jgi:hypothetical protein